MKKHTILITGGAGFIASNVADRYIELGHKVVIIDNLSSGKAENLNKHAVFYKMDIRDKAVEEVFRKHNFDVISLHAAQIDVRKSVDDPVYDADINVLGFLNLMQNAVKYKVKKVIYISSGGVIYGQPKKMPPSEDYAFDPESPYGVTKMVGEYYVRYYAKIHGMKFTALRYSNVYGPRQNPHGEAGVVAIFSSRLLKNDDCTIYGDGKQTRDYVFVGDVVDANVLVLEKGDNQSFNIGTGLTTSVNQLFSMIAKIASYKKKPIYIEARKGELLENYLNAEKAKNILGWKPKTSLEEGLKATVDWIRKQK
jgi:UDP-glucose 4-epimerase